MHTLTQPPTTPASTKARQRPRWSAPVRLGLSLGLSLCLTALGACADESSQDTDTSSSSEGPVWLTGSADYQPTLPVDSGATDVQDRTQDWNPFPSGESSLSSSSNDSSRTQSAPETTSKSTSSTSTSSDHSSSSSEETSSPTQPSTSDEPEQDSDAQTGASTEEDTTQNTGASTESESSTASDSVDTTSTATDTGESSPKPAPSDPLGPQFGRRLELSLAGPLSPTAVYRALIFEFSATQPSGDFAAASPEISDIQIRPEQPRLPFTQDGRAALVLKTPSESSLDPSTRQSAKHAVAVYLDRDRDGRWSEREEFVAALPSALVYRGATQDTPEQWGKTRDYDPNPLTAKGPRLEALPGKLDLHRLDEHRPLSVLRGPMDRIDPRIDFLALLSTAEVQDLRNAWIPGKRGADLHVRAGDEEMWSLSASGAPIASRRDLAAFEIPGIKEGYTTTNWLVGYRRPIGAPVDFPGAYLTPDSQLEGGVCRLKKEVVGLWIDPGPWASAPQGALYAALFDSGVGWSFIQVQTRNAPHYYLPTLGRTDTLGIRTGCSPILETMVPEATSDAAEG